MKLLDICKIANIVCPLHLTEREVAGISSDSREIGENFVFVCLEGTRTDGHGFIDEALKRGACAVVIQNEKYECDRSITVESTRRALSNMLDAFYGQPSKKLKFIGITGTNGKTSVSVMIKNILDTQHIPCELIGTLNCSSFSESFNGSQTNFTTPDPEQLYKMLFRMSEAGIEYVIMEASSHALKLKKLDPINFEIGIFTNLTEDHLDFHHSMEDYFKSKLELFNKCRIGIINVDDEYGELIKRDALCKIKTCSMSKDADFIVLDTDPTSECGTKFKLKSEKEELLIKCNIPGKFSIMNSMQACACALELNIDKNEIERSFESFYGVKGRLERIELFKDRKITVFIDYAHTPDALSKLLETVNKIKKSDARSILVFGCGGDRERQKRSIMGSIASQYADISIITSDNPRSEDPDRIIDDILCGISDRKNIFVIPNRREAIEYAIAIAKENDIVTLAGKGHENYEINEQGKFPFDERKILCEIDTKSRRK